MTNQTTAEKQGDGGLAFALDDFLPEMRWTRNMLLAGRVNEAAALHSLNRFRVNALLFAHIPGSTKRGIRAEEVLRRFGYFDD